MWFTKCCCCDLRPGGSILLMLLISEAVLILTLFAVYSKIWAIIDIIICVLGLYAAIMKKPILLWPTIIWLIFRPIIDAYRLTIDLSGERENMIFYDENVAYYGGIVLVMALEVVAFVIITALKVLTVLVLWSLYKELKEGEKIKTKEEREQVQLKAHTPTEDPNLQAEDDQTV